MDPAASPPLDATGPRTSAREILRLQRELELINNPVETQLEIIVQKGALQQLEFDHDRFRS